MMWKKSWTWRATTNDAHKWSGRMAPWCTSHGNTSQWDAAEWDQEIQKKCPGICCPINCWCSYKLRKKASKKHSAVTELRKKGRFDVVAHRLPQAPVDERPMEMTVGLIRSDVCWGLQMHRRWTTRNYWIVWNGGARKTTLMSKLNNEFIRASKDFEVSIWVVVSRLASVGEVQVIRNKWDIPDHKWRNRTEDEKAVGK